MCLTRLRAGTLCPTRGAAGGQRGHARGDVPQGREEEGSHSLLPLCKACCGRTRSHGSKPAEGRFRLDVRKKFFMLRVVRPWPRLPREVVKAPALETLQARLDGALSSLVWLKMSLLMAGGLG